MWIYLLPTGVPFLQLDWTKKIFETVQINLFVTQNDPTLVENCLPKQIALSWERVLRSLVEVRKLSVGVAIVVSFVVLAVVVAVLFSWPQ